eukprot:12066-Amphidinium_carterae.1
MDASSERISPFCKRLQGNASREWHPNDERGHEHRHLQERIRGSIARERPPSDASREHILHQCKQLERIASRE